MTLGLSAYHWFLLTQNIWQSFALAFLVVLAIIQDWRH